MTIVPFLVTVWLVALVLVAIIHFGYFPLVFILSRLKGTDVRRVEGYVPFVSILIPCYNVGLVIDHKIMNTLSINYPKKEFEIVAVESCSTDDTYSKLRKHAENGKIKLVRQSRRMGKSSAINRGMEECRSNIIVMTDADARLDREALRRLVQNFGDPEVGAAVASTEIVTGKSIASKMNHLFFRYFRQKPRLWETRLDSVSFGSGHLLAFYKSVVGEIGEDIINDDRYILLKTRRQGYRCVCEPTAYAYEADVGTISSQITQKRRTVAGALQGTLRFRELLLNPEYGFFGMLVLPCYLLRMTLLPFLLLLLEALFPLVAWTQLPVQWPFLMVVAVGVLAACVLRPTRNILLSLLYGLVVQIAVIAGIGDFIFRKRSPIWTRVGSPWDEIAWNT